MSEALKYKRDYLTLATLVLFFLGGLVMLFVVRDLKNTAEASQNHTRCVVRELGEHRVNTYDADQVLLEGHGINFHGEPPVALPDSAEWEDACDHILGSP